MTFDVYSDHADQVVLLGAPQLTISNVAGSTLYYADNDKVSASNNQGSLTAGNAATFTQTTWIISASRTTVTVTYPTLTDLESGGGDNLDLESSEGPTSGQALDYRYGTAGVPDATNNPVVKISRTLAIPAANVHAIGDANASAFGVHAIGTAGNQVQVTTLTAFARNVGTAGGTSKDGNATSPDAVALQGFARIQGSGVGAAIPIVGIAHVDTATAKAANSCQLFVYNDSGSDSAVSTTAQAFARGISLYSYGANLGGIGLEIVGPVGSQGNQFDVGVHATGQTAGSFTGGIKTAFLQDDSTAVTSLKVNGSHTVGVDFSGGTFSGAILKTPAASEATSATAGANGAVPAQVVGYIVFQDHSGTSRKIPYFAT